MANASLNIPITGDASAFLAEVERASSRLKELQKEFNDAFTTKGKKLKLEVDASLVEGSIADLKSKIKELEASRDNLPKFDIANFEAANRQIKEYKDEIKRLQGIGIKIDIEPPPPGSINDIKNQIEKLTEQKGIAIGLDLTNVNIKLQDLKATLKQLQNQGITIPSEPISPVLENSIEGLEAQLKKVKNAVIKVDIVNEQEIARLNKQIDELEAKILRARSLSIDPSGNITKSSNKARQAVTSLTLVAQDLPFGFIAIQNNLPAVAESFAKLTTEGKGLKGGLKQLGGALAGPAGLFLAFSAVTAAVTFLVKEYGSLENAYMALTSGTSKFTQQILDADKALKKYYEDAKSINEIRAESLGSVQKEIIKIDALSKVLLDSTSTDRAKQGALADLKKASEEYFGDLQQNSIDVDKLNQSVAKYTEGLIKNAVAQGLATEAGAAFTEFLKLNQLSVEIANEINALKKANPKLNEEIDNYLAGQERILAGGGTGYKAFGEVGRYFELSNQLSVVNEKIKGIVKTYDTLKTSADLAYKEASRFIELPDSTDGGKGKTFALKIDVPDLDAFSNIEKIISRVTKYGDALLDIENTEKERIDALKKLKEVSPEYFSSLDLDKNNIIKYRDILEEFIRLQKLELKSLEDRKRINELTAQFRKFEDERLEKLAKQDEKDFEKIVKLSFDFEGKDPFKELKKTIAGLEIQQAIDGYISKFKDLKEVYNETFPELVKKNKEIADSINGYLTQPLTDVFDILLKEGEKSWKDFGDTVIQTLKRIAVQLIATAIAKTIANILAPGLGSITTAALDEYVNGNDWVDLFPGGPKSQANFGRIRGNQGVSMSGQVNMVLRGNDLVGAMNRTNSTISRVG